MGKILGAWLERWATVRAVVGLAGWVLVALGLAKVAAVGRGESAGLGLDEERALRWERWALAQGVGETAAGLATVLLPPPMNSVVLVGVGAGFLLWQAFESPSSGPCPCLVGLRSMAGWVQAYEREWRVGLAVWFFLVGVLSWRSEQGRS